MKNVTAPMSQEWKANQGHRATRRGRLSCDLRDGPPDFCLLPGWKLRQQHIQPRQDRLLKTDVVVDGSPLERQQHWLHMHRREASLCEELLQPEWIGQAKWTGHLGWGRWHLQYP